MDLNNIYHTQCRLSDLIIIIIMIIIIMIIIIITDSEDAALHNCLNYVDIRLLSTM